MGRLHTTLACMACGLQLLSNGSIGAPTSAAGFDQRVLAVHNQEREQLGLQPLNWNNDLAQAAQR